MSCIFGVDKMISVPCHLTELKIHTPQIKTKNTHSHTFMNMMSYTLAVLVSTVQIAVSKFSEKHTKSLDIGECFAYQDGAVVNFQINDQIEFSVTII